MRQPFSYNSVTFEGVDALSVTGVIALLLGILIITQAGTQLPRLGAGGLVGSIIVFAVVRELGPLLTAFVVIGRSGTAIATELGTMSVDREVAALRLKGIPVSRFVIMRSWSWSGNPGNSKNCGDMRPN